jgi:hypothetical protein
MDCDFYCGDAGGEAERLGVGGEAGVGRDREGEGAGMEVGEEEVSGVVDGGLRDEIAVGGFEAHGGAGDGGSGGVDDGAADGR